MKIPRLTVLLMLIVFSSADVAAFCKWVDESGAVHYAETCPEDVDSTEIETQAPPPQERVEEAVRRFEQLQEKRKVQREFKNQQAEKRAAKKQQLRATKRAQTELCIEARSKLQVLGTSRPVYYDEVGKLHIQWLIDSDSYEGKRRYIDDNERQISFKRWNQIALDNCESDIKLYENQSQPAECQYSRAQLAELEEPSRRTPKSEIEVVKKLILKWCQ